MNIENRIKLATFINRTGFVYEISKQLLNDANLLKFCHITKIDSQTVRQAIHKVMEILIIDTEFIKINTISVKYDICNVIVLVILQKIIRFLCGEFMVYKSIRKDRNYIICEFHEDFAAVTDENPLTITPFLFILLQHHGGTVG
jgi:hypothetical protein